MSKLRLLRNSDLPHLVELSRHAGWNQTPADWERTLQQAHDTAWGIEVDGRVVSSTTGMLYPQNLAWIGMVLTHPEHRGRGHATSLLKHALESLGDRAEWIKLDATDEGKPIYEKLGFQVEQHLQRWHRPAGPVSKISSYLVHDYAVDPSFDRAYFGAYRIPLLNALRRDGDSRFVVGYGYAMTRPGALATYFGPCVVRTVEAARALLENSIASHPDEEMFWDLFVDNKDAVKLAREYGFHPVRHTTRMGLRCSPNALPILRNESSVFAIAGFEYG
jgi:GNAT superfamily N-acetyltransferase